MENSRDSAFGLKPEEIEGLIDQFKRKDPTGNAQVLLDNYTIGSIPATPYTIEVREEIPNIAQRLLSFEEESDPDIHERITIISDEPGPTSDRKNADLYGQIMKPGALHASINPDNSTVNEPIAESIRPVVREEELFEGFEGDEPMKKFLSTPPAPQVVTPPQGVSSTGQKPQETAARIEYAETDELKSDLEIEKRRGYFRRLAGVVMMAAGVLGVAAIYTRVTEKNAASVVTKKAIDFKLKIPQLKAEEIKKTELTYVPLGEENDVGTAEITADADIPETGFIKDGGVPIKLGILNAFIPGLRFRLPWATGRNPHPGV